MIRSIEGSLRPPVWRTRYGGGWFRNMTLQRTRRTARALERVSRSACASRRDGGRRAAQARTFTYRIRFIMFGDCIIRTFGSWKGWCILAVAAQAPGLQNISAEICSSSKSRA